MAKYYWLCSSEYLFDINAIKKILPHRYPFLLIDRILDMKPGESLNAIKNVGAKALHNILEVRDNMDKFHTLFDFCEKLDLRLVNKRVIESLIGAGAMDGLEGNRAQMYNAVDKALKFAQQIQINTNV